MNPLLVLAIVVVIGILIVYVRQKKNKAPTVTYPTVPKKEVVLDQAPVEEIQ